MIELPPDGNTTSLFTFLPASKVIHDYGLPAVSSGRRILPEVVTFSVMILGKHGAKTFQFLVHLAWKHFYLHCYADICSGFQIVKCQVYFLWNTPWIAMHQGDCSQFHAKPKHSQLVQANTFSRYEAERKGSPRFPILELETASLCNPRWSTDRQRSARNHISLSTHCTACLHYVLQM